MELSGYKKNLEEVYINHTYITKKEKRLWQAEQKFLFVQLHSGKIPYALDKWKVIFIGFASFHLFYPFSFLIHRNRNVYYICWWMWDTQFSHSLFVLSFIFIKFAFPQSKFCVQHSFLFSIHFFLICNLMWVSGCNVALFFCVHRSSK